MPFDPPISRRLASIRRDDAEIPSMPTDLCSIPGWIEMRTDLDEEDVTLLAGAAQVALPLRPNAVTGGGIPAGILAGAPYLARGVSAAPRVVE